MDALRELLDLRGYGIYVWPAFAVAALALLWMALSTLRRLRQNEHMLQRLQDIRGTAAGSETEAAPAPHRNDAMGRPEQIDDGGRDR